MWRNVQFAFLTRSSTFLLKYNIVRLITNTISITEVKSAIKAATSMSMPKYLMKFKLAPSTRSSGSEPCSATNAVHFMSCSSGLFGLLRIKADKRRAALEYLQLGRELLFQITKRPVTDVK